MHESHMKVDFSVFLHACMPIYRVYISLMTVVFLSVRI